MRLILITVAWTLAISLARSLLRFDLSVWLVCFAVAVALAVKYRRHRYRWFAFALVAFAGGAARQSLVPQSSDIAQYNGNTGAVAGIIVSEPDIRDDRIQLRVEAESIFVASQTLQTSGQVLVETFVTADVRYGDRIRATGSLGIPAAGDTFSYADYLGRQGVFTMMPFAGVEVIGRGYGSPFYTAILNLKQAVQDSIAQSLPEPYAGLLTGILLGNERGISPELAQAFNQAGAAHIIAISGFNMIVISSIITRVLEGVFPRRQGLAALIGICFIGIYTIFVGAGASIMRAALMSSLLLIGRQLRRNTYVPASLALAALVISLIDPNALLDVGFQLSFFAVLGIGLLADPLSSRFRSWLDKRFSPPMANGIHTFLNEPLIVSIAAYISTLPLTILYFGRASLAALPVNLLIMPAQPFLLVTGMTAAAVSLFLPMISAVIYWIAMVFLAWTIAIVRGFAQFDVNVLIGTTERRLIQTFYLLMIGGAMVTASRPMLWMRIERLIRRQAVIAAAALSVFLLLILMTAMRFSYPDGRLHIWLLDVGHSNAALLQTPNGAQMLIDGGRFPSRLLTAIGDRLPFHDQHIEILAVTHPDQWDTAAISAVLQRYTVGAALYSGQPNQTETFQEIQRQLAHSMIQVQVGYTIELDDGVFIEVLHPQSQPSLTDKLNDHVMALRITYGDVSLLLTSDLSRRGQRLMLENNIHPLASIMQIPQHGGLHALESEFLEQVQPQIALLQSDKANRRDDPDPDVLALFDGVPVFRTDEGGAIHLQSDGRQVWVNRSLEQNEEDSASSS